jgi:hypothetical protein
MRRLEPGVRVLLATTPSGGDLPRSDEGPGFVARPYREHELLQAVRRALEQPASPA